MVNSALLEATLNHVKDFPELHSQWGYFEQSEFGLCACFATRALLIAGYEPLINQEVGSKSALAKHPQTGETVGVWPEAQRRLRITKEQSKLLFSADKTREQLELAVKDLLNTAVPQMDR